MSKRFWILFTICFVVILGLSLFYPRGEKELPESVSGHTQPSSLIVVNDESSKEDKRKRSPSSPSTEFKIPGRGGYAPRPLNDKSFIDTSDAKFLENTFFNGTNWKIWQGASAVRKSEETYDSENILGEMSGYVFFDHVDQASTVDFFNSAKPMIVFNSNTQRPGILTGTFSVVLREGATSEALSSLTRIKIMDAFPDINTFYVTSSEALFSLSDFKSFLSSVPEIKEIDYEIISRQYDKN